MQNAIKKAIEGRYPFTLDINDDNDLKFPLLDPLFWQCLGKSLELEGSTYSWQKDGEKKWLTLWHRFIDYLADGENNIDGFFNNLINN